MARATQHAVARRATPVGSAGTQKRQAVAFLRSDRHGARRALIEDIRADKKGWAQHGIAALAVSLLGLGVAGSVALTGAAQPQHARDAQPKVEVSRQPGVAMPSAFERDASSGRDEARPALSPEKITSRTDQRAETLTKADQQVEKAAQGKALRAREKSLKDASKAAQKQAVLIAAGRATEGGSGSSRATAAVSPNSDAAGGGKSCLPVTGGYTIAARFGQVGPWARYHTGMDFSAPVGTRIHAPASGVVINAGSGPASGWAGTYVAIRYADGSQSLSAHMSSVSVGVGQTVSPCQVVGAVGMTGRTFGPHLHFEIYPAGASPGDVYSAVNPEPWLRSRGLNP
ncbi:MAG TPA: M23 family metallopeptidase [Propionibacteriaceae bacterium]|nr:M23 family metallopeptidase [Propionibacteriaceae bacterium]